MAFSNCTLRYRSLTVVAVINTALVLGSRAGAWHASDWQQILTGSGMPEHPGKTILGGVVLAILLFAGCCYGTATNGGGICYGPGTPVFLHQMHTGLISSEATTT